jgi:pimeloyl-ACP methyl ester carboxylesterase
MAEADPQVAANDYTACNAFDVMERLGQIAAPTLVIGGTADQMTPFKYAAHLAEKIPGARLVMIEGQGTWSCSNSRTWHATCRFLAIVQ